MSGRALLLTSNFPRWVGDSTTPFVLDLAKDLGAHNWDVDVLAPHAPGARRHECLDGISVRRFRYLVPESKQTVCYGGGALVNIRQRPRERLKLPLLVASAWAATARALATGDYDLVNAHWLLPQGLVAALQPRRTPVVTTVHGGDVFGLQGPGMAAFKRWAARRASAVTANSSATTSVVRELLAGHGDVRTIPMGAQLGRVDGAKAAELRRRHARPDGLLIVFVGRLVEEKGVGDLIEAVRILRTRGEDVRAMVVGDGQDAGALRSAAADLGASISFLGWVQPERVGDHLAAADVFVAPSRRGVDGWMEGQGLTVVEAMQAGTPVVATRSGGIVDTIDDGETGLLVEEASPAQLADAIARLGSDRSLAARLAARAQEVALEKFSRAASARRFAELFDEVVERQGSHAT